MINNRNKSRLISQIWHRHMVVLILKLSYDGFLRPINSQISFFKLVLKGQLVTEYILFDIIQRLLLSTVLIAGSIKFFVHIFIWKIFRRSLWEIGWDFILSIICCCDIKIWGESCFNRRNFLITFRNCCLHFNFRINIIVIQIWTILFMKKPIKLLINSKPSRRPRRHRIPPFTIFFAGVGGLYFLFRFLNFFNSIGKGLAVIPLFLQKVSLIPPKLHIFFSLETSHCPLGIFVSTKTVLVFIFIS